MSRNEFAQDAADTAGERKSVICVAACVAVCVAECMAECVAVCVVIVAREKLCCRSETSAC